MKQITSIKNKINNIKMDNEKILEPEIEKHLLRAEEDIKKGRVRDAKEIFEEWL